MCTTSECDVKTRRSVWILTVVSALLILTFFTGLWLHLQSGLSKDLFDFVQGLLLGVEFACAIALLLLTRRLRKSS